MTPERLSFEFSGGEAKDARLLWVETALGFEPGRAVLERPYAGDAPPPPPERIEVFLDGGRVFAGAFARSELRHEGRAPLQRLVYEDARAALDRAPCPGRWAAEPNGPELREGEEAVFNRDGEADKAPDAALFADDSSTAACWSGLDVLDYLSERAFLPPLSRETGPPALAGDEARRRLSGWRPASLACGGLSVLGLLERLCRACGLEMRMNYRSEPPSPELFAPFVESAEVEADAGAPGSSLDGVSPPDVFAFRLTETDELVPPAAEADGVLPELEVTLRTGARYTGPGTLEKCGPWEADLAPDWTVAEQDAYDWVYTIDPWCERRELDEERRLLWHVERRYRVNPAFAFHAFFDGAVPEGAAFEPAPGFSRGPGDEAPPPEVVLDLESPAGWRMPFTARGELIGVRMLEGGRVVLFDRPVSAQGSFNPRAETVRAIGYTLCLRGRTRGVVRASAEDAAPGRRTGGLPLRLKRKGYRLRVTAPDIVRRMWPLPPAGERDDRLSLLVEARAALERAVPRPKLACALHGLRGDFEPGAILARLTFSAGRGGRTREDAEPGSLVRKVRLLPGRFATVLECGGTR